MTRRMISISLVALVLMLTLAGCGNLPGGIGDAQQAVCSTLDSVLIVVNELDGMQAEATVADAKELKVQVDGAIEKVRVANKALNAATINELLTSYDTLSATLDGLDDDATIGDTAGQMQEALAGVKTALQQAGSALKCAQ